LLPIVFIDNGDGTYTVRFFHNGMPDYVTVDNQLPNGGGQYDHPNGVLWAALAEKAYAQLNESGWLGTLTPGVNSYLALDNGNLNTIVTALAAFSGRPASTFSTSSADLATAMSHGKLVVLATGNSTGNPNIEHNHAYAIVGYNPSASQPFTVFNPWGIYGGTDSGTGNFIRGQFTANGAALSTFFYGGGWTGEAAETKGTAENGLTHGLVGPSLFGQWVTAATDALSNQTKPVQTWSSDLPLGARAVCRDSSNNSFPVCTNSDGFFTDLALEGALNPPHSDPDLVTPEHRCGAEQDLFFADLAGDTLWGGISLPLSC
jgi:hypothetical protein